MCVSLSTGVPSVTSICCKTCVPSPNALLYAAVQLKITAASYVSDAPKRGTAPTIPDPVDHSHASNAGYLPECTCLEESLLTAAFSFQEAS
ncbi:unnamed protein product [Didymodactylos carnosus]|uniref:Uncharacterized protein n=1 Tax=Didymodactylos carnosus TaxID=1234261 RepID=A0A815R1T3_9BILA|nr:unnamed protein product [Didymodactylos carnosus]CAF1019766.1 unnamed protein product [Didymodactylos carnosus]CAF1470813.1 unnamed protein product [Didymodactylos carnosus]CAF3788385.1 unnamed protein product [Didymodactylos carnosus]CAF3788403.1 unnamed protein product [Didymodactylos carnosus]